MTVKEKLKMEKKSYELFDTLDFEQFFKYDELNSILVSSVMRKAEERYQDELPEEYQGFLFNFVTTEEFAEYLGKRYKRDVIPVVEYYLA